MVSFPQLALLSISILLPLSQAYFLEPSCRTTANEVRVERTIGQAFALADRVASLFDNQGLKASARQDPDTERLFKLLVGGDKTGEAAGGE
jgi:hypothetical protein